MTLSQFFTKLKNILTAPLPVGGLEISATSLKFLLVKNQTILQASLRLPAGIIVHGEIKDISGNIIDSWQVKSEEFFNVCIKLIKEIV